VRTLLLGDIHITDDSIKEIMSIFDNDIYKIKADSKFIVCEEDK